MFSNSISASAFTNTIPSQHNHKGHGILNSTSALHYSDRHHNKESSIWNSIPVVCCPARRHHCEMYCVRNSTSTSPSTVRPLHLDTLPPLIPRRSTGVQNSSPTLTWQRAPPECPTLQTGRTLRGRRRCPPRSFLLSRPDDASRPEGGGMGSGWENKIIIKGEEASCMRSGDSSEAGRN